MTEQDDFGTELDALGALADPTRRAAYRAVVAAGPEPVSRDDVAAALGVGRTLAAFHLDRLVEAGLLETSFARRTGRAGPGAGRTAKLYRRGAAEHTVTVPPRAYSRAAELLAEAVDRAGVDQTLFAVARERGYAQGSQARRTRRRAGIDEIESALADCGYEPVVDGGAMRLRNCPFHTLAEEFPPLVCGMNLALVEGMLDGLGATGWRADTDPVLGHCCVVLSKTNGR